MRSAGRSATHSSSRHGGDSYTRGRSVADFGTYSGAAIQAGYARGDDVPESPDLVCPTAALREADGVSER